MHYLPTFLLSVPSLCTNNIGRLRISLIAGLIRQEGSYESCTTDMQCEQSSAQDDDGVALARVSIEYHDVAWLQPEAQGSI